MHVELWPSKDKITEFETWCFNIINTLGFYFCSTSFQGQYILIEKKVVKKKVSSLPAGHRRPPGRGRREARGSARRPGLRGQVMWAPVLLQRKKTLKRPCLRAGPTGLFDLSP